MYIFPGIFWACTALIVAVKNTGNKVKLFRKPGAVKAINRKEGRKEGREGGREGGREQGREEGRTEGRQEGRKEGTGKKSLLNYVGYTMT